MSFLILARTSAEIALQVREGEGGLIFEAILVGYFLIETCA